MTKFTERFQELLNDRKISQRAFAIKYNISQQTINHWCTGKAKPDIDMLFFICSELHESADYLLGLKDN